MAKMLKTVFDWDHFAAYLSGAIDFSHDGGRSWRQEWTEGLVEIGFKPHQIFNPCKKPLDGAQFNLDDEAVIMRKHRNNREWSKLMDVMGEIVHVDLRLLDKSDLVLINMPKNGIDTSIQSEYEKEPPSKAFEKIMKKYADLQVPTYGTIHEMVVAHLQRKPMYMVWEGGKSTCSGWLMWLVGHNNVFSTFEELKTRLKNISNGKTAFNAKQWLLFDFDDFQA